MNEIIESNLDYKVARNGIVFAGTHLLVDIKGAINLDNPQAIQEALEKAARAAGATILHSHMHHFSPQGVSGVVVLGESHISIHTWPERSFAAIDIFMCGVCDPYHSIPVIKLFFKPESIIVSEHRRGVEL